MLSRRGSAYMPPRTWILAARLRGCFELETPTDTRPALNRRLSAHSPLALRRTMMKYDAHATDHAGYVQ